MSVLTEVVCATARRCKRYRLNTSVARQWGDRLQSSSSISWQNIDLEFARKAAFYGQSHGLRGMDAMVAATAFHFGLPILAEDSDFDVLKPFLKVYRLSDLENL